MTGAPATSDSTGRRPADRECAELWRFVHQLERLAELGLHSRGLVHDMGNTLTSLLAGLELALLKPDEADVRSSISKSLELAREAAERLHAHVDFTRRTRKQESPTTLTRALEDALMIVAHPLRKSAAHIERDGCETVHAAGSHPLVVQVIVNALLAVLRSVKGSGPTLSIRVASEDDQAVLEIRGRDGEGRRDPSNGTLEPDRTGLELEVARRIVASYGGRLDISPDEARASLVLPVANVEPRRDSTGREALKTWRPVASMRSARTA